MRFLPRSLPRSLGRLLRETALYVGASPLSRWHQVDTLRGLDDHLLRDIGISRPAASGAVWSRDTTGTTPGV
ncbi:MAG TPA: DUF1127 domain-containing protein [Reyranella sp.]|nr:DUF1127 domain-containing protein [Reyranella sp.]